MYRPKNDKLNVTAADTSLDALETEVARRGSESVATLVWLAKLLRENSKETHHVEELLLSLPRVIGRFRLEALLGSGAYGVVFRAFDAQLARYVALKLAWPRVLVDPTGSQRFADEPRAMAAVPHPGIVEVYDSGEIDMVSFIAMELINGQTLAEWSKHQSYISERTAARIIRDVAEAIGCAHAKEIVHRDLKPGNVLLRSANKAEESISFQPVVTDFGLARRARDADASLLTATCAVVGTDHYMSPEQAAGANRDVCPASDVFSLGVMLYELLAGRRPFDGESAEQVRRQIQESHFTPLRLLRPGLARDLATIVAKCLEAAPERRYRSARELADDLTRFLRHEPIHARPITPWRRLQKFARRRPHVVALAALMICSVIAVGAFAGAWLSERIHGAQRIAAAEAAAAVSDEVERQHRYVASMRHAAASLRNGSRRNVIDLLRQCRELARPPLRCGIEWDYLWSQLNDFDTTIDASRRSIHSVRFSPAGDVLISGAEDGRVILWNAGTWTKHSELNVNVGEVRVAEPSPDGSLLAVAGWDGRVVVHRLADGTTIFDEQVVNGRVFDAVWLGTNQRLAVGGEDAELTVLDLATGQRMSTPPLDSSPPRELIDPGHPVEIAGLAFIPDQNSIAVTMKPSGLRVFDISTLTPTVFQVSQSPEYNPVCFLPLAPGYLVTRPSNDSLRIRNVADSQTVADIEGVGLIRAFRYFAGTATLAAARRDGTIETWDAHGLVNGVGSQPRRSIAHEGHATTVDFSPDGRWLASGGEDGQIRIWERPAMQGSFDVAIDEAPWRMIFSPCGRWLAVLLGEYGQVGRVVMLDAHSGNELWTSSAVRTGESTNDRTFPWLPGETAAFDPTGSEVVLLHPDFSICGHDSRSGEVTKVYSHVADEPPRSLQMAPDGRSLIITHADDITFIERSTAAATRRPRPATHAPIGLFRTTLGKVWLRNGLPDKHLTLCAEVDGDPIHTLAGFSESVSCAAVSQDGRNLAVAGFDRVIYIWDLRRSSLPIKCIGHDTACQSLAFSPDGCTLLSHAYRDGTDGTVRFWHVPTGTELLKLGSRESPIISMGLSPTGDVLATGINHNGKYGLRIHRLDRHRDSAP